VGLFWLGVVIALLLLLAARLLLVLLRLLTTDDNIMLAYVGWMSGVVVGCSCCWVAECCVFH
jgi:hypothetical protein